MFFFGNNSPPCAGRNSDFSPGTTHSSEWDILATFATGEAPDLSFYLWIAKQPEFQKRCTKESARNLLKCIANLVDHSEANRVKVFSAFQTDKLLYVEMSGKMCFASPSQCVWRGPQQLRNKAILQPMYDQEPSVSRLINTVLKIEDTSIEMVLEDLKHDPSEFHVDQSVRYITRQLHSRNDRKTLELVRDAFRTNNYSFLLLPSGVPFTQCVWGGVNLPNKINLESFYRNDKEMQEFCCDFLGIGPPTFDDYADVLNLFPRSFGIWGESIYSYISENFTSSEIRDRFERDVLVHTWDRSRRLHSKKKPSDCVWTAPDFLICKQPIASLYKHAKDSVIDLLQNTLVIKDATVDDYMADLRILKSRDRIVDVDLRSWYKAIEKEIEQKEQQAATEQVQGESEAKKIKFLYRGVKLNIGEYKNQIRQTFEKENLIYDQNHEPPRWVTLKDCVWGGGECLKWSTDLADHYSSLGNLFKNYLGVTITTPEIIITKLLSLISDFDSQERSTNKVSESLARTVIECLLAINNKGYTSSPLIREALRTEKLWPYHSSLSLSYELNFGRLTDNIIIPDNEEYLALFREKALILYLTPKEVRSMRSLFLMLDLKHNFLSSRINSTSSLDGASLPSASLSRYIAQRAEALFCCHEHFNKHPNPTPDLDLLQSLKQIQVFRVFEIFTTYTLEAYGTEISVKTNNSMRLDETTTGKLELLVPHDEDARKEIFVLRFTKELIAFLRLPEAKSWQTIMAVMTLAPEKAKSFLHQQDISTKDVVFPFDSSDFKENQCNLDGNELHTTFGRLDLKPKEAESNSKTGQTLSASRADIHRSVSPTFKTSESKNKSRDITDLNPRKLQIPRNAVERSKPSPHPTVPSSDSFNFAIASNGRKQQNSDKDQINSERRFVLYSSLEKGEARVHEEVWSSGSETLVAF
ncbi:hypothetical protein GLAREA_01012 [Glarea lozoyensis ATCC 20868]|uniref:Uncharacterized protein n=1 Tax=Glarea lozoyensis (strain ATCC 20868 / MF5171) TaxID=1116229 RepID=S3CTZ0_GLAL2|nr:uncharacterized protein GLAREA_01012 [Glarea lozoyensis ATCC 20868]EPE29852.1 hypothetical protein GLAREA_01012 [Glarea lozoyensis ATCC 20868]